jgi:hypothetical protein
MLAAIDFDVFIIFTPFSFTLTFSRYADYCLSFSLFHYASSRRRRHYFQRHYDYDISRHIAAYATPPRHADGLFRHLFSLFSFVCLRHFHAAFALPAFH